MNKFIVLCIALSMVAMTQQAEVTLGTALEVGGDLKPSSPVFVGTGAYGQNFVVPMQDTTSFAVSGRLVKADNSAAVTTALDFGFVQEDAPFKSLCRLNDATFAGVAADVKVAAVDKKLVYKAFKSADGAAAATATADVFANADKTATSLRCANVGTLAMFTFTADSKLYQSAVANGTWETTAEVTGSATGHPYVKGTDLVLYYVVTTGSVKKEAKVKADGGLETAATVDAAPTAAGSLFTTGTEATFNSVKVTWTFTKYSNTAAVVKVAEGTATAVEVAPATAKWVLINQFASNQVLVTYWSANKVYTRVVTIGAAAAATTNSFKLGGNFMMMIMMIVMLNMI